MGDADDLPTAGAQGTVQMSGARNGSTAFTWPRPVFRYPKESVQDLIIVEGFPSVWWLHQNGFPNVLASMGNSWSEEQIKLVLHYLHPKGRAWVITDGDFDGRRGAGILMKQIVKERLTRLIDLPDGKQPTDFPVEFLNSILPK
jgi:hypothetical protein